MMSCGSLAAQDKATPEVLPEYTAEIAAIRNNRSVQAAMEHIVAIESQSRPIFLQWFHWAEATLMPPISTINGNRFVLREEDRSDVALDVARRQLARALRVLGAAVEGKVFLVDDTFSAADIMTGYGLVNAKTSGELPDEPKSLHLYLERLTERPGYQRAFVGGFS